MSISIMYTHVWTISKVIDLNKEKEICLLNKEYMVNMVVKCIVQMYITADLKAYWLLVTSLFSTNRKKFMKLKWSMYQQNLP